MTGADWKSIQGGKKDHLFSGEKAEKEIELKKKGADLHIKNWKLSSYLNTLARHQFRIEQVVEETTAEGTGEARTIADHVSGKYYSEEKAGLMNLAFVIKARKQG